MLQERCRPLAQSGVIEAPRVQLENGLLRTKQKPTSLPTLHDNTRSRGAAKKFHTRRVGTTGEQLEKIRVYWTFQGSITLSPAASKGDVSRVATISPLTAAVAAIYPSAFPLAFPSARA